MPPFFSFLFRSPFVEEVRGSFVQVTCVGSCTIVHMDGTWCQLRECRPTQKRCVVQKDSRRQVNCCCIAAPPDIFHRRKRGHNSRPRSTFFPRPTPSLQNQQSRTEKRANTDFHRDSGVCLTPFRAPGMQRIIRKPTGKKETYPANPTFRLRQGAVRERGQNPRPSFGTLHCTQYSSSFVQSDVRYCNARGGL